MQKKKRRNSMVEVLIVGNIPVPIFVPDDLPDLPEGRRVDEEEGEEE
jgi:hypothetical protein